MTTTASRTPELIQANVRRLRKLVERLRPHRGRWTWAGYREAAPYTDEDAERKERFVREAGHARGERLVIEFAYLARPRT